MGYWTCDTCEDPKCDNGDKCDPERFAERRQNYLDLDLDEARRLRFPSRSYE
jgi:hypothetical protein